MAVSPFFRIIGKTRDASQAWRVAASDIASFLVWASNFSASAVGQVWSGSMTCNIVDGSVTPTVRAEGLAELAGNIVVVCTGGTPLPAGNLLPSANIRVSLTVSVTSRILGAPALSQALLIVDEPGLPMYRQTRHPFAVLP